MLPSLHERLLFLVGYLGRVMASAAFGISVGYPISQSALVVAGLWCVFYFQGDSLIAGFFVACGLIVLGGVGLKLS
jgi:glucose uptake protein GlcU